LGIGAWATGAANTVATGVTGAANTVATGVTNAANTVATTFTQLGQTIKTTFDKIISDAQVKLLEFVVNQVNSIKSAITSWFNNPIIAKVISFAMCASSAVGALVTAAKRIKGIIDLISGVASGNVLTITKVIINLICKWQQIATIVKTFQTAFSNSNVLVKYFNIGSAVGQIFALLGDLTGFRRLVKN